MADARAIVDELRARGSQPLDLDVTPDGRVIAAFDLTPPGEATPWMKAFCFDAETATAERFATALDAWRQEMALKLVIGEPGPVLRGAVRAYGWGKVNAVLSERVRPLHA